MCIVFLLLNLLMKKILIYSKDFHIIYSAVLTRLPLTTFLLQSPK